MQLPNLQMSRPAVVLTILAALALVSIVLFMTLDVKGNWGFVFQFRGRKLLSLLLVAFSIAVATVLFQTVTNNRILTPAIMGFDQLYILVQTGVVFFIGTHMLLVMDTHVGFFIQLVLMVGFSWILFYWLFLSGERSLHLLVLVGIVFGIFFRSLSNFMQRLLDPNAFQVLQDTLFASFTRVDPSLLGVSLGITAVVTLVLWHIRHTFDVLTLGKATAINLGVDYKRTVVLILVTVSVLVSVSTALVGPRTFFGLLVASLAHMMIGNSRHKYILPAAVLLGVICLIGGQTLFERVFAFDTALSIIIEFLGGLVFILLVIRGAARR